MILDLLKTRDCLESCDVLVIGAGTAGLLLTTQLHEKGFRVLCVESGGYEQENETHEFNRVIYHGSPYAGAELGRFRCLGGTSTRWGGAMIPFLDADLEKGQWPIRMSEYAKALAKIEEIFSLPTGGFAADLFSLENDEFCAREAKWPPFKKRNVYRLLKNTIHSSDGPRIYINATVTQFSVVNHTLSRVRAEATDGTVLNITPKKVVIASGCIESTRLILLLQKQNPLEKLLGHAWIGTGFHDHLSCIVAELKVKDRRMLNRLMGFKFSSKGTMRNLRFEMNPNSKLRENIPPCFFHVSFDQSNEQFDALRVILRSLQRMSLPPASAILRLFKGIPWLLKALYWRIRYKKLLYPENAAVHLHAVMEQQSIPLNKIKLSEAAVDQFGVPLAEISWQVTQEDQENLCRAVYAFADWWAVSSLNQIATLKLRSKSDIVNDIGNCGGIYHPGGTTRMANNPISGVVDKNLKVFGLENTWVVSTSVMPTGGASNPTMTLLMLALKCVDDIEAQLGMDSANLANKEALSSR